MGLFSSLFGNKSKKIQEFVSRDAVILDVRTKGEFQGGAIPGSKNIPLQQLSSRMSEIKKWNKPVICCCASGMRSGSAATILRNNHIEAMNGGGWASLQQKI
jgi:rhodanese-related sulfurtransferase